MYSSTEGFEKSGFTQTGAVAGFGWDDIKVLAVGSQFQATDKFALRAGYNYSDNPIPEENSFFNVAAPAVIQHHLTLGFGFEFHEGVGGQCRLLPRFRERGFGPHVASCHGPDPAVRRDLQHVRRFLRHAVLLRPQVRVGEER